MLAHLRTRVARAEPQGSPPTTAAIAVSVAVFALACSGAACRAPAALERARGGPVTLRVAVAGPNLASRPDIGVGQLVTFITGEPLVRNEADGRPTPRLAKRWDVSADGLTWRFELRPSVKFHDGSPVTADAVRTVLLRQIGALQNPDLPPGLADVVAIEAPEPAALVIHLARPSTLLLEDLGEVLITSPSGAGTGPFVLEKTQGAVPVLRAFSDYYGGRPGLDRIEIRPYPTVRTAWASMLRGDVDFLYEVGVDAVEFVKDVSSVQVVSFVRPYAYLIGFNVRHPVLRSPEVRRALNLAVDRRALTDIALQGFGVPADSHIWPQHWAYDPTVGGVRFDPEAAGERLARAGYPLPDVMHAGVGRQPSRFRFTCMVPEGPEYERVALVVQKQLFDIGVDMAIEQVSVQELARRGSTGEFDAFLVELIGGRFLTWPYRFWHSPTGRTLFSTGYRAADDALDRARHARSEPELRGAIRDYQQISQLDPPAIFLAWMRTSRAVSRRFLLPPDPDRDIIGSLRLWRLNPEADTLAAVAP